MSTPVAVIVPVAGALDRAWRCFETLAEQPHDPSHEIVVVDQGAPGLDALLARLGGDVRSLRMPERSGFVAAANAGAASSDAEVVVVLCGTPALGRDWLSPLLDRLCDPEVAAATSVVGTGEMSHPAQSAAIAVPRSLFVQVGGFPDVGEAHAIAALSVSLAAHGRVEAAPGSVASPQTISPPAPRHRLEAGPELSIVIPTLEVTGERLRSCLAAIASTTLEPHEVIVIGNGASPQGYTAPVNAGVRAAAGRYIVIMNDDVETLPGWWPPLRAELDAGATVAFPMTIEGAMRGDFAAWCFAITQNGIEQFSVSPSRFLDERFVVWYQDTDLLVRLRAAGCPPVLVQHSQIRHGLSQTVNSTAPELSRWIRAQVALDQTAFQRKHPGLSVAPIS